LIITKIDQLPLDVSIVIQSYSLCINGLSHYIERIEFENSHILAKIQKIFIASRIWESQLENKSILYAATTFDL